MKHHDDQSLSTPMTILGMVNGMIGGLILILPVYALEAGYIMTLIVIAVTCVFSYYSCYLCIIHMGKEVDLDYAILRHFNGSRLAKIVYDLCVWTNLILLALLYFELIMIQWQGLIPPHETSFINPLVNSFVLLALVFILKYFEFGASIMAYGIISIVCYIFFLVWVVATYDQGNNDVQYKPFGTGAVNLAAAMGQAFSIQSFFIPVLKKNPNQNKYALYTLIAYIAGGLAYYYIAYTGSIGIWHRTYKGESGGQETIEGYFGAGTWEVNIVQAIYLIHLYSVFPQFTLISKRRMFHIFQIEQSQRGKVNVSEIIYVILIIGICFVVGILEVDINDIIDINGAVVGFLFIYLLPAILHIKCLYFSKGKRPLSQASLPIQTTQKDLDQASKPHPVKEIEIVSTHITGINEATDKNGSNQIQEPLLSCDGSSGNEKGKLYQKSEGNSGAQGQQSDSSVSENEVDYTHFHCDVSLQTYSKYALVADWILIVIMLGMGVFIMINGIYTVAT